MASNLECIGMAASSREAFSELAASARSRAIAFGRVGDVTLLRWEDPSGARLILGEVNGDVIEFLPSFASERTTRLARLRAANDEVAIAAVVAADGEQLTSVAFECEQRRLLPDHELDEAQASLIFLGRDVSVHADAASFAISPASLLDPNADANAPAPSHYVERGWKWPPRVGAESFFSHGVFGDASSASAGARFAGQVLSAERRTVELSNQTFIVAHVHTVGIEATVCLSGVAFDSPPRPGEVLEGEVFVVGSVRGLESAPRLRQWRSRFRRQ